VLAALLFLVCQTLPSQTVPVIATQRVSPEFREAVTLSGKEGIVEVRLTAHQSAATLDTVAKPALSHYADGDSCGRISSSMSVEEVGGVCWGGGV
jgi:hypothetical protein